MSDGLTTGCSVRRSRESWLAWDMVQYPIFRIMNIKGLGFWEESITQLYGSLIPIAYTLDITTRNADRIPPLK